MANDSTVSGNHQRAENLRATLVCLAVFLSGAAVLHIALATAPYTDVASNLKYLMSFAAKAAEGKLPYRDFPIEYPPLGALWLCAFAPFSGAMTEFRPAFTAGMTLLALAGLPAVWRVAGALSSGSPDAKNAKVISTVLYTALLVGAGPIGIVSFDFLPATLAAWALALKLEGRGLPAAGVLAAGTAAKLFPAVMMPIFLYHTLKHDGFSKTAREFFVFISVVAILFGLPFLFAPEGFVDSFKYHIGRGVEAGSIYAAAIHIARIFGAGEVPVFSHGSWGFQGGGVSGVLGNISTYILLAAVICVYVFHGIRTPGKGRGDPAGGAAGLAGASAAALLAFILFFKVGSPQFFAWPMAFVAGVAVRKEGRSQYYLYFGACVLSQMVFPWFWEDLIFANPVPIAILALEKVFLLMAFAGMFPGLMRNPDSD